MFEIEVSTPPAKRVCREAGVHRRLPTTSPRQTAITLHATACMHTSGCNAGQHEATSLQRHEVQSGLQAYLMDPVPGLSLPPDGDLHTAGWIYVMVRWLRFVVCCCSSQRRELVGRLGVVGRCAAQAKSHVPAPRSPSTSQPFSGNQERELQAPTPSLLPVVLQNGSCKCSLVGCHPGSGVRVRVCVRMPLRVALAYSYRVP